MIVSGLILDIFMLDSIGNLSCSALLDDDEDPEVSAAMIAILNSGVLPSAFCGELLFSLL